MKLTRYELKTIHTWCVERNHCKHELPSAIMQLVHDMLENFPTGKTMKIIDEWWDTEIDVSFEDGTIAKIVSAIIDNTSMEDAQAPWGLIDELKRSCWRRRNI